MPMIGADLRRFRRAIGWNQIEFAEVLGVTQSALSQMESGRYGLSEHHLDTLKAQFNNPDITPTFNEYCKQLEDRRSAALGAVEAPHTRFTVLVVWDWEEGFDLSTPLPRDQSVGLIAIDASDRPAIAIRLKSRTQWWNKNEILAFELCSLDEPRNESICLLQLQSQRGKSSKTMIAISRPTTDRRGPRHRFLPVSPSGSLFAPEPENVLAVMKATFRCEKLE